jgi:NTP pyrophosphatase (non-canonical NTP hydrolase)
LQRTSKKLIQDLIFSEIIQERLRQREKWGADRKFDPPYKGFATVLGEEFGEVCRAILENDPENLRDELIQVAATAIALLEQLTLEEYSKKVEE